MKGIVLAGGTGSRLWPITKSVSKQLLPVYDKPLIYYPLTTLMLCGIREFLLISTPTDLPLFKKLFEYATSWGIDIQFAIQDRPEGLAQALILGEKFIGDDDVALVLGDNLFHGVGLGQHLQSAFLGPGALICAYQVSDPRAFGVVEFNENGLAVSLEEKPQVPKSTWAVPGIYFYDETASQRAKKLRPSKRGELEITDLNISYLVDGALRVQKLPRGTVWLDMGTPEAILEASEYVRTIQNRQGLLVGSPEEAAWRAGWITDEDLTKLSRTQNTNEYYLNLSRLLKGSH